MRPIVVVAAASLGAALLASVSPSHAKPDEPAVSASEKEAREKSRAAFRAGVQQLQAKDWKAARSSFESAWQLYPHPSILLNLGIARLRTDEPVLAEQDFVRFLSEDFGATPEELAGAREALAEARMKIGTIKVVASPRSARIVVDGKEIAERVAGGESTVAEVRAKAGKHAVRVEAEGHAAQERSVDLAARADIEVKVTLVPTASASTPAPPEEGTSNRTILGYGLAGLAVVGVATTTFCGFRAIGLASDYEDPNKPEYQQANVKSEGVMFRTVADVALGVTVVSAVAAVILLFTDVGSAKSTSVARSTSMKNGNHPLVLRW